MPAVKHMKWWGWGVEGVAFHHEDKPAFRDFVIEAIGVDLDSPAGQADEPGRPDRPRRRSSATSCSAELTDAVGAEQRRTATTLDRVVHTYGKSVRDLMRLRAGDLPRVPDVVVYPADEAEVQLVVDRAVAADAVLIPFGGGSNISGSLHAARRRDPHGHLARPRPDEQGLDIDEESGPGPDPGRRARPRHRGAARDAAAGRSGTSPTASPTAPSAAGSRPAPRACSPTSTATSPTSPAACGWCCRARSLVVRAAAQHLHRPERPRDDPGLRGPARRDHRGDRAGAPHPREPGDPRLPVPELGGRPGRDAGDLDQRRQPVGDPGLRRRRDPVLLRHPQGEHGLLGLLDWSARAVRRCWSGAAGTSTRSACPSSATRAAGRTWPARRRSSRAIVSDARRHRARQGPGRALRPEEVRHPLHPRLPARPRRRGRRLRDRGALVPAAAALRRGHRGGARGVRAARA